MTLGLLTRGATSRHTLRPRTSVTRPQVALSIHHDRVHMGSAQPIKSLVIGPRWQEHNDAPSGSTRSRTASRYASHTMPGTVAEAMARARLLLYFPPAADKMDE